MTVNVGSVVIWTAGAGQFGANQFAGGEKAPAIVTRIWNAAAPQTVNLHVLPDQGHDFSQASVPEDDAGATLNSWALPAGAF